MLTFAERSKGNRKMKLKLGRDEASGGEAADHDDKADYGSGVATDDDFEAGDARVDLKFLE